MARGGQINGGVGLLWDDEPQLSVGGLTHVEFHFAPCDNKVGDSLHARDGDPLPKVNGKDGNYTITIGEQTNSLQITERPGEISKVSLR